MRRSALAALLVAVSLPVLATAPAPAQEEAAEEVAAEAPQAEEAATEEAPAAEAGEEQAEG